MDSLTKSSYLVQGINIHILCQAGLQSLLSNYFNSLYRGTKRFDIEPLEVELEIVEEPPSIPRDCVQVVKSPSITCYGRGNEVYFTTRDGSIILLHATSRYLEAFLTKEILEDASELFSLICSPFIEVLKHHGLYSMHSAAVYGNGRGYLISGGSGSGKTTSTLTLVTQGFKYVSDDFVLLEEISGEIITHSLYKTFNLDRDLVRRFPQLIPGRDASVHDHHKVSVDVSQGFPDSFISRLKPDVIIFPRIMPRAKSHIYPLNRKEAFTRLLKQIVLTADKETSKKQLRTLEKLVRQTVSFELLSGRDVYEEPQKLVDIINRAKLGEDNGGFNPLSNAGEGDAVNRC